MAFSGRSRASSPGGGFDQFRNTINRVRSLGRGGPVGGQIAEVRRVNHRDHARETSPSGTSASGVGAGTPIVVATNPRGKSARRCAWQHPQSAESIWEEGTVARLQHGSARTSCMMLQKKYREFARALPESVDMASRARIATRTGARTIRITRCRGRATHRTLGATSEPRNRRARVMLRTCREDPKVWSGYGPYRHG